MLMESVGRPASTSYSEGREGRGILYDPIRSVRAPRARNHRKFPAQPLSFPMSSIFAQRIRSVQAALADRGLDAVIVPSSDPHLSEYLPERWQARQWLSGFTGSVGTLVVTRDHAALFADSRYWVQAEGQLEGSGIELVKIATGSSDDHVAWLCERLPTGQSVCVDGTALSLVAARTLGEALGKSGITLREDVDIIDRVWPDRPALPAQAIFAHEPPHAVKSRAQKLASVRASMAQEEATHHFLSTVDDVAWLFDLRGTDVTYNPVFLAHALISQEAATLFVVQGKVPGALAQELANDGIELAPYDEAANHLARLSQESRLLVDPQRVTRGLVRPELLVPLVETINPSTLLKSRKSEAEARFVREVMAEDGAAMCEFYAWFEAALGNERITELTIDERLSAARAKRPGFKGLSFATIAAFNANGAMPHYRALEESHAVIEGDGLLLIDSGGQYLGGTTDITRVWPIGRVTDEQRRDYTLVLKGTVALSRTRFPEGTLSPMLDAIARAPLWQEGLEYGHGTGHGVGYFLNVHEGPQTLSKAIPTANMAMRPGMITSIEPGLYRPGRWGIRIENLVLNVPSLSTEFGEFLEFETLTLCPIDTRLIERSLLDEGEVDWLNRYHDMVRERLSPKLDGAAKLWLEERTRPI